MAEVSGEPELCVSTDRVAKEDARQDGDVVGYTYTCKKCRAVLFSQKEIVPHDTNPNAKGNKQFSKHRGGDTRTEDGACTSYFLDPDMSPWVASESRSLHAAASSGVGARHDAPAAAVVDPDTIYCPACRTKVGAQNWVGSQCSCGAWVTPAFKIHCRSVDKMPTFAH